jgi:hypothetical protein
MEFYLLIYFIFAEFSVLESKSVLTFKSKSKGQMKSDEMN